MAHKKDLNDRISDPRVDRIWEYLKDKKMNLKKLVEETKLSYPHVCNMMNGRKPLSFEVLGKITQGLKLPMGYFDENEYEINRKPRTTKKSQLMSEILTHVEEILSYVEKNVNVDGLRKFFTTEPTRPLIATGHGGKYSQASYAALLYSTNQGLGRAVTCYSCNSLSDATIQNSKILLVSRGMANIDIDYIAQRCLKLNPSFTCAMRIVGDNENQYQSTVKKLKECEYSFEFDLDIELSEHFIGISSVFFYSALLYKTFTNDCDFVSKLELNPNPTENYTYSSANGIASVPSLSKISHFTVLYGSYAEPVAYNIESNIVESGIASCMISDYKNYTHGRFMVEGNFIKNKFHPQTEAALICLVTPREAHIYEDLIEEMPPHLPVITIRTDLLTPLATIDLLYKANMFASHLGEHYHHTNPNDPNNFGGIDKRVPKNYVDFKTDFKIWGALDVEAEKKLVKELKSKLKIDIENVNDLFKIRDEILAKEPLRTEDCRHNWSKTKPLSWEDFSFREAHLYDTQKQECWSFNSRTDIRDGIPLKLGNMGNDFGVEILGVHFPNSEVPYQLAIFNNEKDSVKIQEEIINPEKGWLYNGLKTKRTFVKGKDYGRYRRDRQFEDGKEMWCFEWMKWIVWEKVKQNEGFREILLAIPKEAVIIEQAQKKTALMWGAWNDDLLGERKIVTIAAQIGNGLGKSSRVVKDEIYKVNNVGEWVGQNSMGQILTMAKLALNEGVEMPIDEAMLNEAQINWFGKVLHFTKGADGKVTVKAIAPRLGKTPRLGIIGNICGDILGFIYERKEDKAPIKALADKEHVSLQKTMTYSDDTVLTIAVARWLLDDKEHSKDTLIDLIREYGSSFKKLSFSNAFKEWVKSDSREPFGDIDDGSAMRVSPIGYYSKTMEECLELAKISAEVTHNTDEGIRGAQAVAACVFLAKSGKSKKEIKEFIADKFPSYDLNRKTKDIRPSYECVFNCDNVVPESIICYLEGRDYEETVKLAISLGGDTDTMACISGGIAAVNMPVPEEIADYAYEILPPELRTTVDEFNRAYGIKPKKAIPEPTEAPKTKGGHPQGKEAKKAPETKK